MSYIFQDGEILLVRALQNLIRKVPSITQEVHVGTTKKDPAENYTGLQVIVRSDGGAITENRFLKEETFGVNIYGGTNYENAQLAYIVEALIIEIPTNDPANIRATSIDLTPARVDNPTGESQRYLTGTALIGVTDLALTE